SSAPVRLTFDLSARIAHPLWPSCPSSFRACDVPETSENYTLSLHDALPIYEIDSYWYNKTTSLTWICQVNGVTLDDYGSPTTDEIGRAHLSTPVQGKFHIRYTPGNQKTPTAAVTITVDIPQPGPVLDNIIDG